jgi:hypothetical protein
MERLTAEEKKENLKAYRDSIAKPTGNEVRVRVAPERTFWYCPTPGTCKLYAENEELNVPEEVFLNSDYDSPKKSVSGMLIRGVLRLASRPMDHDANNINREDLHALQERNAELERKLAALTGATPPTAPAAQGKGKPKKEEI